MTQVAILGAGFAGLSAAWLLKQRGVDFVGARGRSPLKLAGAGLRGSPSSLPM